jgi:hypothetical protein
MPLGSIGIPASLGSTLPLGSLMNSSISIPTSLSMLAITAVTSKNPAVKVIASAAIASEIVQSTSYTSYQSEIIPDVSFTSPTYYSDVSGRGLNNSYISVSIPQGLTSYSIKRTLDKNVGINYNVHGSVFKVNKTTNTVRNK